MRLKLFAGSLVVAALVPVTANAEATAVCTPTPSLVACVTAHQKEAPGYMHAAVVAGNGSVASVFVSANRYEFTGTGVAVTSACAGAGVHPTGGFEDACLHVLQEGEATYLIVSTSHGYCVISPSEENPVACPA